MCETRSCRPPSVRSRAFGRGRCLAAAAEVRQRKQIELPARCSCVRQSEPVPQDMQMRIEFQQQYVALGKRASLFNKNPADRTQDKSLSPQCDKRPLAKLLSKLRKRGLMRL